MVLSVSVPAGAQFRITPSADIVSSYVWRGVYTAGASFQPGLSLEYKGLSLAGWGSTDFNADGSNEFDLSLGYTLGNLSLSVTNYWWSGLAGNYTDENSHLYEATVGYGIGNLSLSWNTFFAGADKTTDDDGKEQQAFSSYFEASYGFDAEGVTFTPAIGISPWTSSLYHGEHTGFTVSNLSLTAGKEIRITESFSLPVFVRGIYSPSTDKAILVFGLSF
jgi:hypothetical protein